MPADAHPPGLRPPLKWAGGKRWQLPLLAPLWRKHARRRLVEPFCGGLGVALGLRPATALLNDRNPHLINFYEWVRRGLTITIPMANDRALYAAHRSRFNELLGRGLAGTEEAASLFYFLNRTGFNGLCRFNQSGLFNVPFGRYAAIRYERDFTRYRPVFRTWRFTTSDIDHVPFAPEDFVYADPPYDVPFTQYSKEGFGWTDQIRAAERLARHPGPVVLVNQATPRIERLYRDLGYTVTVVAAPRRISSSGDRRPANEVMALRNV